MELAREKWVCKCFKISNTYLYVFLKEMLVIRTGIHKMHVRIANKSDLGLSCLSRPF